MDILTIFALMLTAALVASVLGFFRTVYFVSLGYGFSMAAQAGLLLILFWNGAPLPAIIQNLLLIVYGLRLGGYLTLRESKAAYRREAKDAATLSEGIGFGKKLGIWVGVALLYVAMGTPGMFNIRSVVSGSSINIILSSVGVAVMALGLGLEALADIQKSRYKTKNPDHFCNKGLYSFVRCPNYLGEIIFWSGNVLAGASALFGLLPWLMVICGWICITLIMLGSTKRLEARQEERYGNREDFRQWCAKTPVLFPFLPVYSLKNVKVYLE